MKTFTRIAAQGEITIVRVSGNGKMPKGYVPLPPGEGKYIVGHSETGHHHVLSRTDGAHVAVLDRPPAGMRILRAILTQPMVLEHLRPHDTHDPIALDPGEYEIRIAREYDYYAVLARQSAD
jgi:hypothetical protein